MKKLTIDIGNTAIKSAVFDDTKIEEFSIWNNFDQLAHFMKHAEIGSAIIASVSGREKELISLLPDNLVPIILTAQTPLPIKLHYKTVDTLGVDRIAGVMGAYNRFPNENNLVIDIGTCITYDFINYKNQYLGGAISPGIDIRLKSLNYYTGKLPKIELPEAVQTPLLIGDTTESAIQSGVLNGSWAEMRGFIDSYSSKYQKINTIITGGDSYRFESLINPPIFVAPKLVLQGLNCILDYNEQEN